MLPADFQVKISVEDQERFDRQMKQLVGLMALAADSMPAVVEAVRPVADEFSRSLHVFGRAVGEYVSTLPDVERRLFLMENGQCE